MLTGLRQIRHFIKRVTELSDIAHNAFIHHFLAKNQCDRM